MLPSPGFAKNRLRLAAIALTNVFRIYHHRHPDPLGCSRTPSRFSDPTSVPEAPGFGVLYLGESLKVCFAETLLRDKANARLGQVTLPMSVIESRQVATIASHQPLTLVDLRRDGPLQMGIPSDAVRSSDHNLGRAWSLSLHQHPQQPDGIIYPSRLNEDLNVAVYDRAIGKLHCIEVCPLTSHPDLLEVLELYDLVLM
jgi:hypothetical protein